MRGRRIGLKLLWSALGRCYESGCEACALIRTQPQDVFIHLAVCFSPVHQAGAVQFAGREGLIGLFPTTPLASLSPPYSGFNPPLLLNEGGFATLQLNQGLSSNSRALSTPFYPAVSRRRLQVPVPGQAGDRDA